MKKKIQKLIKNPRLFFYDMAIKHRKKIGFLKNRKPYGFNKYTIVTAVYNVEKYLNDYFKSIVDQNLNFKNNIHIILVDDGSTDSSAKIIKSWQNKYKANITYIYKENGGQASARNIGLQYVKTKWVTFIDPDDFISSDYFIAADNFLEKNATKKIAMVVQSLIFYFEDKKQFSDTHSLKYRFKKEFILPCQDMGDHMNFSACTSLFITQEIKKHGIYFDERIKPNFEDGHFILKYLLNTDLPKVAYIPSGKYFYRKRSDGSSTLDNSWKNKGRYKEVLEYGYLDAMLHYKLKLGKIPKHVQRTMLYDLTWHFKQLVNKNHTLSFMNDSEKIQYYELIKKILLNIEDEVILEFNLIRCWFYYKVGMLNIKGSEPKFQIAYIEGYDEEKQQILISYFTNSIESEEIIVNGEHTAPAYSKCVSHEFVGNIFLVERRLWINTQGSGELELNFGKPTRISFGGKQYSNAIKIDAIIEHFESKISRYNVNEKYNNCWVFIDRIDQADDNAEHLYRYIKNNHPSSKMYFILKRDSHDWKRLKNDGFNLISFNSHAHKKAMMGCSHIISSHADAFVTNYLGNEMLYSKKFIFLQHGVTKDNLSNWLNGILKIDLFVTATRDEYKSITEDGSPYKFTNKEVKLTGFPRHDKLIKSSHAEKVILVMPTWRKYITGFKENISFSETEFAIKWSSFLNSTSLKAICDKYNYKVIFFPHANMQPYLSKFDLPNYVSIQKHSKDSIQNLFQTAKIMVTDYSSVAFEMAIQGKPVIYYQFDEKHFFAGEHVYAKGYFEYRKHGFGPVVNDQKNLITELLKIIKNNGRPSVKISNHIRRTFHQRDGESCKRVYQAILALGDREVETPLTLKEKAENATLHRKWPLAETLWRKYSLVCHADDKAKVSLALANILIEVNKISEVGLIISEITSQYNSPYQELERISAKYFSRSQQWIMAIDCLRVLKHKTIKETLELAKCLSRIERNVSTIDMESVKVDLVEKRIINAYHAIAKKDFLSASTLLPDELISENADNATVMLYMADIFITISRIKSAHSCLLNYENSVKRDPDCDILISALAFRRKNWEKTIAAIETSWPEIEQLPVEIACNYLQSLYHLQDYKKMMGILFILESKQPNNFGLIKITLEKVMPNIFLPVQTH